MSKVSTFFRPMRCFVIGEVAQAHDGSLGMAHAFVDAIANAGADAVKFQTHIAEAESTPDEKFRVTFSYEDKTRYDYWKRMEFTEEQWRGLKKHAVDKGLIFLSSPFSIEAVALLEGIGITAWKIGSGELNSLSMIEMIARTQKHTFISSGISNYEEIDRIIEIFKRYASPYTLMQCTTSYPTLPEQVGLNILKELQERYDCPVGISDHSGTIYPGLAAVTLGASAIETHVTLSKEMFGPDVSSSVTTQELKQLVEGVRFIEKIMANPIDKSKAADNLLPLKKLFGKSAMTKKNFNIGGTLALGALTFKKPGTGLSEIEARRLAGKKFVKNVKKNCFVKREDLAE